MSLTRNFLLQIPPEWHYDALGPILRLIEHTIHIDIGQSKILNLDADEQRNFIAFTDTKTIITNDHNFKIDIEIRFSNCSQTEQRNVFNRRQSDR